MILYLDTSALLKKYFREDFSDDVISLWMNSEAIATSYVTYAETSASINRKKRELTLEADDNNPFVEVIPSFQEDWESLIKIEVNDGLNVRIDELTSSHPLRGFDSIHLASAMVFNEPIQEEITFVCFDKKLLLAAKKEGLRVFPEGFA